MRLARRKVDGDCQRCFASHDDILSSAAGTTSGGLPRSGGLGGPAVAWNLWNRAAYARRVGVILGAAAALTVPLFVATTSPAGADTGTGTIAVCLTNSQGTNVTIAGDHAWYQANGGSIDYVGAVGHSGCRESSFASGASVAVWVATQGTFSQHKTVTVTSGETTRVNFYTTDVTIQYPGAVAFGGIGNSAWFKQSSATASRELLSNGTDPTMFRMSTPAGLVYTPVSWPVANGPGASASFSLMALQVLNNDGSPEGGASAVYTPGQYTHHVPGSTNASGLLGWAHSGLLTNVTVTAKVNDTASTDTDDVSTTGLFRFQTTNLTLHYTGGEILYHGGYWDHFTAPSMELFAGTYPFQFSSGPAAGNPGGTYAQTDITVPDPTDGPVTKTAAVVRFQDSTGAGLTGSVSYYLHGWHNPGVETDMGASWGVSPADTGNEPGSAVVLFDGAPTGVVFALSFQGERQQLPRQNIQTDSVAYFHTADVAVELLGSNGLPLRTGQASYYARGWHGIGDTSNADNGYLHIEMLPGSYSFAMTYKGTREQLNGQSVSGSSSTVTFQTGQVNSTSGAATGYYAAGWRTFANGMELLPGSYWFHFNDGTGQAKETLVGATVNTIH